MSGFKDKFKDYQQKAQQILQERGALEQLLQQAKKKAGDSTNPVKRNFAVSIRLVTSWLRGDYTTVPWRSVVLLTAGLLYFVNPLDAVPDFLGAVGLADDFTLLTLILRSLSDDLEAFKEWEKQQNQ